MHWFSRFPFVPRRIAHLVITVPFVPKRIAHLIITGSHKGMPPIDFKVVNWIRIRAIYRKLPIVCNAPGATMTRF